MYEFDYPFLSVLYLKGILKFLWHINQANISNELGDMPGKGLNDLT